MPDLTLDTDHGVHTIEEAVKVYLEFDGKTWRVAPAAVDGYPLDSPYRDRPVCDRVHDADPKAARECAALLREAAEVALPTAAELIPLIAEKLDSRQLYDVITALHEAAASRG